MFLQIIESSSSGNCGFLEFDGVNILIDAGVGITKIKTYLKSRNLEIDDIDAIFITHEHGDHCDALKSMKDCRAQVYANKGTASMIQSKDAKTKSLKWNIFQTGETFDFKGVKIYPLSVPHDTTDAVGYCFNFEKKCLVWMTDCGKVTLSLRDVAKRANVLVVESNYCPRMLENSTRKMSLKKRISGTGGHLSNADTRSLLEDLSLDCIEKVFLSHISKDCNDVEHIAELMQGMRIFPRVEIVSPFEKPSSPYEF